MSLKEFRNRRNWSQDELAQLSGISVRTIQRIERDNKAGLESLRSLAAAFNIDVAELTEALNMVNNDEEKEQVYANRVTRFYIITACLIFILIFPLLAALRDPSNWGAFVAVAFSWALIIGFLGWQTFAFESAWKDKIISNRRKG